MDHLQLHILDHVVHPQLLQLGQGRPAFRLRRSSALARTHSTFHPCLYSKGVELELGGSLTNLASLSSLDSCMLYSSGSVDTVNISETSFAWSITVNSSETSILSHSIAG